MEKIVEAHVRQFSEPSERIGTTYVEGKGTYLKLWAPLASKVEVEWVGQSRAAVEKQGDYFNGLFADVKPGARYWLHIDDEKPIPDPASRYQPEDSHGPSEVVASEFAWTDRNWQGVPFDEWVIYEIHPGTFSDSHDFDGIIADLPRLKNLGINAIEIMPVSQFSGDRNWGYDGVFPHAVQHSYGGPEKFKALVDACHAQGLAIILDCVYNHIGPEGNVLFGCGPYVRDKYHTPWGPALNFDGPGSDDVRRYFLQSAWQWLTEFHLDGLRLDAVQMIFDNSPVPFLQELSLLKRAAEKKRGVPLVLTGESDMNDSRLVVPADKNGLGLDAHWADDFHHCLHATLTGEHGGYYADYGGLAQLAKIYRRGVAFEGDYAPYHKRRHGRSYEGVNKKSLIVETQNHDQTGNRLRGERLISLIGFEKAKLAAACVLLSPFTPFLFMGEEYASERPFMYFISHHGDDLMEAVRKGRAEEWKDFAWTDPPPDPGSEETFGLCVLNDKPEGGKATNNHAIEMENYYRSLIALSKEVRKYDQPSIELDEGTQHLSLTYEGEDAMIKVVLSFNDGETSVKAAHSESMSWRCVLASSAVDQKPFDVQEPLRMAPFSAIVLKG